MAAPAGVLRVVGPARITLMRWLNVIRPAVEDIASGKAESVASAVLEDPIQVPTTDGLATLSPNRTSTRSLTAS
jgi:hypothetical protein